MVKRFNIINSVIHFVQLNFGFEVRFTKLTIVSLKKPCHLFIFHTARYNK